MHKLPTDVPRCLKSLGYRRARLSDTGLPADYLFNAFYLACPCGNADLRVQGYWLSDAEHILISPLAVECTRCGMIHELFDSAKDGHDGEIDDSRTERGSGLRICWNCNACGRPEGRLIASFGYQFDPGDDSDDDVVLRQQDYFDAFILTHRCLSGDHAVEVAMFDCA